MNKSGRNTGIDVLRGVSIISVILLHLNIRVPFSNTYIGSILPQSIYKILFWSGYYGVCTFFVLSGFLITTSALNKWKTLPDINLHEFYLMRFARIMPLLVALLLILSAFHLSEVKSFVINQNSTTLRRAVIAALTFHVNWLEIKVGYLPGPWDVLWSLSIEEVFYLFFPLLCLLCRKEWHFAVLVSIFLIISPSARTVWYQGNELGDKNHFAYLDVISLGCVAAIISRRVDIKKSVLNIMAIIGSAMMLLILVFRFVSKSLHLGQMGVNITVLGIGTALVLIWMQKRFESGQQSLEKGTGALSFMGQNSYEIYLSHMFVVILVTWAYKAMGLSGEWAWVLYISVIVLSGLLGATVARYYSNPANNYFRAKYKKGENITCRFRGK